MLKYAICMLMYANCMPILCHLYANVCQQHFSVLGKFLINQQVITNKQFGIKWAYN